MYGQLKLPRSTRMEDRYRELKWQQPIQSQMNYKKSMYCGSRHNLQDMSV